MGAPPSARGGNKCFWNLTEGRRTLKGGEPGGTWAPRSPGRRGPCQRPRRKGPDWESQSRRGQIPLTAGAELRCTGQWKAEQSRGEQEWGWGGVGFLEVT